MKSNVIKIETIPAESEAVLFNGVNDAECLEFCPIAIDPETDGPMLLVKGQECRPGMFIVRSPIGDNYFVCDVTFFHKYYRIINE